MRDALYVIGIILGCVVAAHAVSYALDLVEDRGRS